jgi:hypothetical protein
VRFHTLQAIFLSAAWIAVYFALGLRNPGRVLWLTIVPTASLGSGA